MSGWTAEQLESGGFDLSESGGPRYWDRDDLAEVEEILYRRGVSYYTIVALDGTQVVARVGDWSRSGPNPPEST